MNFYDDRLPMRFWNKVQPCPTSGCWLWTGSTARGYGRFSFEGSPKLAHRVAYSTHFGSIENGMHLDHLCRVRRCVNPLHLEPVTGAENTRRGLAGINNIVKRTCPRGHEYDADNTFFISNRFRSGISRACRICKNERNAAYRARQKQKTT